MSVKSESQVLIVNSNIINCIINRILMKYLMLLTVFVISCSSLPKEIEPNYRWINMIIQNPDTLRFLLEIQFTNLIPTMLMNTENIAKI